uniref:Transposase (putative) gypsy type domain-containing protein n=1 Tax=Cajanus cajan TaxID=3821 RepID=A0A151T000_CAJCA|nr:hypothetical protein KK1_022796 [Cajanus cajan]
MWKSHKICKLSISKLIRVKPCQPGERVYMAGTLNTPFFYMYQCFFRDLGVCLPFMQFECDFLNFVNVAPYQLHPNSWGFLRTFQVLCSALGMGCRCPFFFIFTNSNWANLPWVGYP